MNSPRKRFLLLSPRTNLIVLAIVLISAGVVPILLTNYFNIDREVSSAVRTILYIILATMLGGTVLQYLLIYLEPANTSKSGEYEAISEQIAEIKDQIKNVGTVEFDITGISEGQLIDSLKATIDQRFTEGVLKSIDEEFARRDLQNKQWERFITGLEETKKRLFEETGNLARRANLNLALGTVITILAGVGLVLLVLPSSPDLNTYIKEWIGITQADPSTFTKDDLSTFIKEGHSLSIVLAHYIPRLSLIIFTELFAYFFLRLYKNGLDDIKYYQNELTNVELKISALKVALASNDNEILKLVIGELAKAERNFILKKDETTVELERIKSENLNAKDWLTHLQTLLETKK